MTPAPSLSTPAPTPPVPAPADSARRSAQIALATFLAVLVGLLAFRGYGNRLGFRPAESVTATRLDLNRADRAELEQVPSIGPKLAGAIDDYRREKGPFRSVDDLRDVRGVGPATVDKVRPYLRVDANAGLATDPASPDLDPPLRPRPRPTTRAAAPSVSSGSSPAPRSTGAKKLQPGDPPVNVNTASSEELQRLPAVGPVTAQNILAARADRPFRSLADLDRVKGIGPKTLEKLRPFVVVE